MATVVVTPVAVSDAGVDPSSGATAATTGNTYTVKSEIRPILVRIANAGASTAHATVAQPGVSGERKAGAGKVIAVAAGATEVAYFDPDVYGDPLSITVDANLSITALQLPLVQSKATP